MVVGENVSKEAQEVMTDQEDQNVAERYERVLACEDHVYEIQLNFGTEAQETGDENLHVEFGILIEHEVENLHVADEFVRTTE